MHHPRRLGEQEIVHQRPVPQHRLRPHPGRSRYQIVLGYLRQQPAHRLREGPLGQRAAQLARPIAPVAARYPPCARVAQRPGELPRPYGPPVVPLAGQGGDRIGPDVDAPADAPGEMHAEEGEGRVGDRVHQAAHQVRTGRGQVEVLPAERHDPHPRVVARQPGDAVAAQPRAVDQGPRPYDLARRRAHRDRRPAPADHPDLRPEAHRRPGVRRQPGQPPRHRAEVAHASRADMDRREAADVGLELRDLRAAQLPHRDAVLPAALDQGVQARQLRSLRRDDQLARDLVRDAVLDAELDHLRRALHREPGLQRPRPVIDAAVDHAAVTAGLMAGRAGLLLQHDDAGPGRGTSDRIRRRQADDPAPDHQHIALVRRHHVTSRPESPEAPHRPLSQRSPSWRVPLTTPLTTG